MFHCEEGKMDNVALRNGIVSKRDLNEKCFTDLNVIVRSHKKNEDKKISVANIITFCIFQSGHFGV